MTDDTQDWLSLYENAIDSTTCKQLISLYDSSENKSFTGTGVNALKSNNRRGQVVALTPENSGALFQTIQTVLSQCYKKICREICRTHETTSRF